MCVKLSAWDKVFYTIIAIVGFSFIYGTFIMGDPIDKEAYLSVMDTIFQISFTIVALLITALLFSIQNRSKHIDRIENRNEAVYAIFDIIMIMMAIIFLLITGFLTYHGLLLSVQGIVRLDNFFVVVSFFYSGILFMLIGILIFIFNCFFPFLLKIPYFKSVLESMEEK